MKSNDKIPEDEMLLAEALAAVVAKRLGWCDGTILLDYDDNEVANPAHANRCCALGGLVAAGVCSWKQAKSAETNASGRFGYVATGNDDARWMSDFCDGEPDQGESLGWAFRCAMTQDESDPATEALLRERGAL